MVALSLAALGASAADLSPLKVLLVADDPDNIIVSDIQKSILSAMDGTGGPKPQIMDLRKISAKSYADLLRQHFKTVKVQYAADYKEAMSAGYDVTVFAALPPLQTPEVREPVPGTNRSRVAIPPKFLSEGFSDAAILIADISPQVSDGLKYKLDWLCLCLDAHAQGMKLGHPIFHTPNNVKITLESRQTPPSFRSYFAGRGLTDTMPMWRVQSEGYGDGKGYPAGLVSSGSGFEEGGDAEVISGGVCLKGPDAVAIGRHGNFFHWGFSAIPRDMTPEARLVFVNAVHYIARFKGQKPYSLKIRFANSRESALESAYSRTRPARSAEGQAQAMATSPPASMPAADAQTNLTNYAINLPYLKPTGGRGGYEVDEDVRSLGFSNRDPQLLELCVAMLESNLDTQKATRILTRYTGEGFKSAPEWRQWLDRSRGKLYFSDINGFRFFRKPD